MGAAVLLNGGTGVTLFYVTSAFALCHAWRQDELRASGYASYALRRLFRIAPLFYVVLALSILRDGWLFGAWPHGGAVALNAGFLFNLWPGHETRIVWASWTIGVEMLFYVVFPFLAMRAESLAQALALLLVLLLVAAAWSESNVLRWMGLAPSAMQSQAYYGVLHHMPVFACGILVYRAYEQWVAHRVRSAAPGAALLSGAALLYLALLRGSINARPFPDAYYWQAVVYSALLAGAAIYPAAFIVNAVTLFLGQISYSLYLLHPMVVYALVPFYRKVETLGWPATASFGVCASVTLAVTSCAAALTFQLIGKPGMRLGRALTARIEARQRAFSGVA